jgi:ATP-dependent Clp protease adaptor protein ClpS
MQELPLDLAAAAWEFKSVLLFSLFPCIFYKEGIYMPVRTDTGTKTAEKPELKFKEPEEFRVILLNDDYTTREFVVEILIVVFHKSAVDATRIMLDVHRKGRGLVGMYPWDIAQTRVNQVHEIARKHEFPLRCIVE